MQLDTQVQQLIYCGRLQALLTHSITTGIHWVQGLSGNPGNADADGQFNLTWDASRCTVIDQPYRSASNRAGGISEARWAAKAKWEADKYSKHFRYRLNCKTETRRFGPMTSVKSLATRFYWLHCRHSPTGVYPRQFSCRENDKC